MRRFADVKSKNIHANSLRQGRVEHKAGLGSNAVANTGKPGRLRRRRSQQQRLEALRKANEIRARRSKLKKDLATGKAQIHKIIANPPDYARAERLTVLLLALHGYGPARVNKLLLRTKISESKRLGGLTDRQRTELIQHFHH